MRGWTKSTLTTQTPSARRASHLLIFLTIGYLWSKQDEKVDMEKEPDVNKNKNRNI